MTWTAKKPAMRDGVNEFPTVLQDRKSDLSIALGQHFYWQESSGASAGEPRYTQSASSPGSARCFVTTSTLTSRRDGDLSLLTSMGRIGAQTSVASVVVGSRWLTIHYSASTATVTEKIAVESGVTWELAGGATIYNQPFASAYSAAPDVMLSIGWAEATAGYSVSLLSVSASGFSFQIGRFNTSVSPNSSAVCWFAKGRRTLL